LGGGGIVCPRYVVCVGGFECCEGGIKTHVAYEVYIFPGGVVRVGSRFFEVVLDVRGEDPEGACHWPVSLCIVVELSVFWWGWEGSPW
jgi:hypothetical protein